MWRIRCDRTHTRQRPYAPDRVLADDRVPEGRSWHFVGVIHELDVNARLRHPTGPHPQPVSARPFSGL